MSIVTVWQNGDVVKLHQLSDEPEDGTPQEQIAYLATLEPFQGYSCVSEDYQSSAPDTDPSLWRWNGNGLVSAQVVPEKVSPRQVRLLLLQQGLLPTVEAMMKSQDQATQIAWQYAEEFRRDNPILAQLASNLGLTDAQVDQFFIAAAEL